MLSLKWTVDNRHIVSILCSSAKSICLSVIANNYRTGYYRAGY